MCDEDTENSSKLMGVAKEAARGGLWLFLGNTSSILILVVGSTILARILGPSDYGLYSVALTPSSLMMLFTGFGVNQALVRFTAKLRSEGSGGRVGELVRAGLYFELAISAVMFLLTFLLADYFAVNLLKRPSLTSLVRLSAPVILGNVLVNTSISVFTGLDKMDRAALISIIRSSIKTVLSPLLIFLGFSLIGALVGHVLASLIGGVIGTSFIVGTWKNKRHGSRDFQVSTSNLSLMIRYGLPLYASALIVGLLTQYQSLILAWFASDAEIGNYSVVGNFSAAVALLTTPIANALFPAFSKLNPIQERGELNAIFINSLKYTFFLVFPASIFLLINSSQLVELFYGSSYTEAPIYLTLYSITFFYTSFTLVLGGFLSGIGRTDMPFKSSLTRLLAELILLPTLTRIYGIQGFIWALIISGIPGVVYLAKTAHSKYGVSFGLNHIAKICLVSLLSAIPILALSTYTFFSPLIKLLFTAPIFTLTYLTLSPILGIIERQDIANIALIVGDIKFTSILFKKVLSYEEKLLSLAS